MLDLVLLEKLVKENWYSSSLNWFHVFVHVCVHAPARV